MRSWLARVLDLVEVEAALARAAVVVELALGVRLPFVLKEYAAWEGLHEGRAWLQLRI